MKRSRLAGNGAPAFRDGYYIPCGTCQGRIGVTRRQREAWRQKGGATCSSCARDATARVKKDGKPTVPKVKRPRASRHVG